MCGAISEDDDYFVNDRGGRYVPSEDWCRTINQINEMVRRWLKVSAKEKEDIKQLFTEYVESDKLGAGYKWYMIEKFAQKQQEVSYMNGLEDDFNVLTGSFYEGSFDEPGVTQDWSMGDEGGKLWVVFVDMHS